MNTALTATAPGPDLAASIGRSALFGIFASVVQILSRLITVPFVIAHLGIAGFGIWSIIITITTYMRFGSVGIRSAFQKYVAEASGSGDYLRASRLLSTGSIGMLALSAASLLPVVVFSGRIARAAGVSGEFSESAGRAIAVLGAIILLANGGVAYESIVMGAHRIDLTRKLSTVTCLIETAGITAVLALGHGLFAMALIMAVSELAYVSYCFFAARRVLPQVEVGLRHIRRSVAAELIRFAGSYQLVSVLQAAYATITPIAILRSYGAQAAGVYAVATRLTSPIAMCQYAFLLPVLSGGAAVYASGSIERMRRLVSNSFRATIAITLLPVGLLSAFGSDVVIAWTGEAGAAFQVTIWLVCLSLVFQSLSLVGLVFYRTTGRALLDNIREAVRILVLLPLALFAPRLGLYGVLLGMAFAEFLGMLLMFGAVSRALEGLSPAPLLRDLGRFVAATAGIVALALVAANVSVPAVEGARTLASLRLAAMLLIVLAAGYPVCRAAGAIGVADVRTIRSAFRISRGGDGTGGE